MPDQSKHPGGRPLKFSSVEELERLGNEFFTITPPNEWTITGLALHLDTTRETISDYANKDQYSDTLKRFKLKVENAYEKRLINRGNAGDIFALKNFGWKDKQETEISGKDGGSINQSLTVSFVNGYKDTPSV